MAVVITQVGVVSPFGRGLKAFQEGIARQECVLTSHPPLQHLDSDLAGISPNSAFAQYLNRRKAAKLMTPAARLAMDSVGQIWDVVGQQLDPLETGLFLSVGREPPDEGEAEAALIASAVDGRFSEKELANKGRSLYPPLLPLKTLPNLILGHLSIHFGLCGENAAWAGEGVQAFIEGVWSIQEGRAERVIVGASDSLIDLGQARDLLRLGIDEPPAEAAVAFLLEEASIATGPALATLSFSENSLVEKKTDYSLKLRKMVGFCGVVEPQLDLLASIVSAESRQWHGLMVHSTI